MRPHVHRIRSEASTTGSDWYGLLAPLAFASTEYVALLTHADSWRWDPLVVLCRFAADLQWTQYHEVPGFGAEA